MVDWSRIEGFDWDVGNSRKNATTHDVSQTEAEQIFFNEPLLVLEDGKHSQHELRLHALGRTDDDRRLHVTLTLRGEGTLLRVISARDMSKNERTVYAQAN